MPTRVISNKLPLRQLTEKAGKCRRPGGSKPFYISPTNRNL